MSRIKRVEVHEFAFELPDPATQFADYKFLPV